MIQQVVDQPKTIELVITEPETTHDLAAYDLAYLLVATLDERFVKRFHLRDCGGQVITRLDQWLAAVAAGRWPVEYCQDCGEKVQPVPGGNGICEVCWSEGK